MVDIDDTVAVTDYPRLFSHDDEGLKPYEQASAVLNQISRDFRIIYLTARPLWRFVETRSWLKKHGFPPGPVLTTNKVVDALRPRAFKTVTLAMLRQQSPEILIGIGDRPTDIQAYAANRMLCLVVNPRPRTRYLDEPIILKDWSDVARFFHEQRDVLADPARLRERFGVGGPSPDPATVRMSVDANLSLLPKLLLIVPVLLIEPLLKADLIVEQAEAERALRQIDVPFEAALAEAAARYGEKNLLKIRLGIQRGQAVYHVWINRDGTPLLTHIHGTSGQHAVLKRSMDPKSHALAARPRATVTFDQAMAMARAEVAGEVYEVELEMDSKEPTYEVAVMAMGRFVEVEIHAVAGTVLEVEDETAVR